MLTFDQHSLSLFVRWIHVCSMALLLGGTILLFALAFKYQELEPRELARWMSFAAQRFELLFWVATGIQVITGIGNLGAFGANLPAGNTQWGLKFLLKLSIFLLLMAISLIRSLLVVRSSSATASSSVQLLRFWQGIYAGTGLILVFIVLLAVSLAH